MPLTRESVELLLTRRVGGRLTASGLYDSATDTIGSIASLAWPISKALASLGIEVADITNPTDTDLSTVDVSPSSTQLNQLLDVAELYALEAAWGNLAEADERTGSQSQSWDTYANNLLKAIEMLRKRVSSLYGVDETDALTAGTITLNFDRYDPSVETAE